MDTDEVIARARSMLDRPTLYVAGCGGRKGLGQPANDPAELIHNPRAKLEAMPADERRSYEELALQYGLDLSHALRGCDCSGFVCWVYGLDRRTSAPDGKEIFTGWIWRDAKGANQLFVRIDDDTHPLRAEPGALLVYPDTPNDDERYGHVGIVTEVDVDSKPMKVVHCSAKNFRDSLAVTGGLASANAIAETDPAPFFAHLGASDYKAIAAKLRPGTT